MKMENLSCGLALAKILLMVINVVFFIAGTSIFGFSLWLLLDKDAARYIQVVTIDNGEPLIASGLYILVAVGAFIMLLSLLGCWGAFKEVEWQLNIYTGVVIILLILQIAAGIVALVYQKQLGEELEKYMSDQANTKVSYKDKKTSPITLAWNAIQVQLECCGGKNYRDYRNSTFRREALEKDMQDIYVPVTCCILEKKDETSPKPLNSQACQKDANDDSNTSDNLQIKGCFNGFRIWLEENATRVMGVAFGLAGFQLFAVVAASCLSREIKKHRQLDDCEMTNF
eukprot:GHVU01136131.1.p1 GENE.GHVU01136131.1~~GHVU01136131.1.p1  ORF type:complete len:285 (+),score=38.25 GHVU01136131.1:141-995(+)